MAKAKTRKAKQRFVGLRIDEVSLVDDPANEEEWIVMKRKRSSPPHPGGEPTKGKENDSMAGKTKTKKGEPAVKPTAKAQGKPNEPKAQTDSTSAPNEDVSVTNQLAEAQNLLGQLAPAMKSLQDAGVIDALGNLLTPNTDEDPAGGGDGGGEGGEGGEGQPNVEEIEIVKADFKKIRSLVARLQKLTGAFGEQFAAKEEGKETKKAKIVKDADGNDVVQMDLEIAKTLQGQIGKFIEESEADKPKTDQEAMAIAVGTAISKALEPVTKSMTGLAERVENMESARGESNAGGSDHTTQKNTGGGSVWTGNLTGYGKS